MKITPGRLGTKSKRATEAKKTVERDWMEILNERVACDRVAIQTAQAIARPTCTVRPRKILRCVEFYGKLASAKNSRVPLPDGRWVKQKSAQQFLDDFRKQVARSNPLFTGPVSLHCLIWYPDNRQDLDIALLQDALQGWVYENDRQVVEVHAIKRIGNPPQVRVMVEAADDFTDVGKFTSGGY